MEHASFLRLVGGYNAHLLIDRSNSPAPYDFHDEGSDLSEYFESIPTQWENFFSMRITDSGFIGYEAYN